MAGECEECSCGDLLLMDSLPGASEAQDLQWQAVACEDDAFAIMLADSGFAGLAFQTSVFLKLHYCNGIFGDGLKFSNFRWPVGITSELLRGSISAVSTSLFASKIRWKDLDEICKICNFLDRRISFLSSLH